jgi:hypothetical protein
LSAGSNASSVTLSSVRRTGRMRCALQTKSVSAVSIGTISIVPARASASFSMSAADPG